MKLWEGRFSKETDARVNDFNSSIGVDNRLYRDDIAGSIAHAEMLGECGIISKEDSVQIVSGLRSILSDLDSGKLSFDPEAEDIHMFVETELTRRCGSAGKRLHTARSRNDQVALDMKLYLRRETGRIRRSVLSLIGVLMDKACENKTVVMPGYTHMQRAQPITFAHHLLAYCFMLSRDAGRLSDCAGRMDKCPLGACALAGTTYPTDRKETAAALGFSAPAENSLDAVSDRDYCIELVSAISIIMMHLSRLSEEIILWCSSEFKFVELDDGFATGSSIMPQKKNPDVAELIRGKTGRVYGDLLSLLTMMKGLPLAYDKDMQEDKEAVFDACDTVNACISTAAPMIRTMRVLPENMKKAAAGGFTNATDCADYLVKKGVPFRDAHSITGKLVAYCVKNKKALEELTLDEMHAQCPAFDSDVYEALSLNSCVEGRRSEGGPALESVERQITKVKEFLTGSGWNEE